MQEATTFPTRPEDLTDQFLNAYIEKFLDIRDFKSINNGKELLQMIRQSPQHPKLKPAIRKVISLFSCQEPAGRVCSLQFLKEALEAGSFFAVECIEKSVLPHLSEIVEYRSNIKNIQRGSTYFMKEIDKDLDDDGLTNIVRLSTTFFRMIHQCLFVWGALYFPASAFDRLRIKIEKKITLPKFPNQFKFFSENKVNSFKQRCGWLIKKVEQKGLQSAQTNSVISRRSESIVRDREGSLSPKNIKKAPVVKPQPQPQPQPQRKQPSSLGKLQHSQKINSSKSIQQSQKMTQQLNYGQNSQRELQRDIYENPPTSNRSKKHKLRKKQKDSIKPLLQQKIKVGSQQKNIENNNSEIRKKNSITQIPIGVVEEISSPKLKIQSANNSSMQLNKHSQLASKDLTSKGQIHIKTISESEESDGGRYSIQQSKQSEISQILYDYNRMEKSSPRSQYSLTNRQKNSSNILKRQNSDQLQPSLTIDLGKQNLRQTNITIKPNEPLLLKNIEIGTSAQTKIDEKPKQKKNYSFKLPLNQLKSKRENNNHSTTQKINQQEQNNKKQKERIKQLSSNKNVNYYQEENMKNSKHQIKNIEKIIPVSKKFDDSVHEYQNQSEIITKAIIQIKSSQTKESPPFQPKQQQKQQKKNQIPILPPKQKQYLPSQDSKETPIPPIPPMKVAKPMKIKSNLNMKTVFESKQYTTIDDNNKIDRQIDHLKKEQGKEKEISVTSEDKNTSKQQQQQPQITKIKQKRSIFEIAEAETIQTIDELIPINSNPIKQQNSPHKKPQSKYDQSSPQPQPQPKPPHQKRSNSNEDPPKIKQILKQKQHSQDQQRNHEEILSIKNITKTRSQHLTPQHQEIQQPHQSSNKKKQIIERQFSDIRREKRNSQSEVGEQSKSLKSIRNDALYSSRRFRHFKQVNLFIQPKAPSNSNSQSSSFRLLSQAPPPTIQDDSLIRQTIKGQIQQQFSKIKSSILQKQQQILNQTIMSLQSEPPMTKKQNELRNQIATQTKLRLKSRSKFQRRNKFKLIDQNLSEENITKVNIPAETDIPPKKEMKKVVERQEEKPNTLLYALYRRRSSFNQ